jgi:hypothetical protein
MLDKTWSGVKTLSAQTRRVHPDGPGTVRASGSSGKPRRSIFSARDAVHIRAPEQYGRERCQDVPGRSGGCFPDCRDFLQAPVEQ